MPKLSVSISRMSVAGLKLVILSADFLLNLEGAIRMFGEFVVVSLYCEIIEP